jgi:hypothetical protein
VARYGPEQFQDGFVGLDVLHQGHRDRLRCGVSLQRRSPYTAAAAADGTNRHDGRCFPRVVDVEIARHSAIGTVRVFLTHSFRYLRWLGFRYWSAQLLIAAGSLRATVFHMEAATTVNP